MSATGASHPFAAKHWVAIFSITDSFLVAFQIEKPVSYGGNRLCVKTSGSVLYVSSLCYASCFRDVRADGVDQGFLSALGTEEQEILQSRIRSELELRGPSA